MVQVAGVEPARVGESTPANKQNAELSVEVLTHLSDEDRQMLSQIVERWGDLSKDLKRAVLAVGGVGDVGVPFDLLSYQLLSGNSEMDIGVKILTVC